MWSANFALHISLGTAEFHREAISPTAGVPFLSEAKNSRAAYFTPQSGLRVAVYQLTDGHEFISALDKLGDE